MEGPRQRLLSNERKFVWVEIPTADGGKERLCLWAMDLEAFYGISRMAVGESGDLDTLRFNTSQVMHCLRDGEPPDGKPVLGDWRKHNDFVECVRGLRPGVVVHLARKIDELTGMSGDSLDFTGPEPAASPET